MPGTQVFSYVNYKAEAVHGTPVAPTRQLYVDCTGVLTPRFGLNFHTGENTGRRYRTRRATQTTEDWDLSIKTSEGVSFDDLILLLAALKGGLSGVGAGGDKTWTGTPSATAANDPTSWTMDIGDDIQNWRAQWVQPRSLKLSAELGELTQLEMECYAQRAIKVAKATPGVNVGVKIPGDLWTFKFASAIAGLAGASVVPNFVKEWELELGTGLIPDHTMDGNLWFGQAVETDISGTLTMTVESTALAVSEFYDKAAAQTMAAVRLRAQGPVLGGSFYSAQIDFPILYDEPSILDSETDGINLYKISGHLADDGTNGIIPVVVNSLAALP